MRALGTFILGGRLQAIGATSLLSIISLLIPPLSYIFSGVPVSLVTLRRGSVYGLHVILGSLIAVMLFALFAKIEPHIATMFAIGIWGPIWLCANTLRMSESQGRLVLIAGIIGIVYVTLTHVMIDDVTAWWQNWLDIWVEQSLPAGQSDQYKDALKMTAPLLNAMVAAGIVTNVILTTMIARWWQASLYNPGGFKKEFYELRLPKELLLGVLLGLGIFLLDEAKPGTAVLDILVLLVFLYLFQGLATIHRAVAVNSVPKVWLVILYLMLFIIPQAMLFVACIGMVDSFVAKQRPQDQNDNS